MNAKTGLTLLFLVVAIGVGVVFLPDLISLGGKEGSKRPSHGDTGSLPVIDFPILDEARSLDLIDTELEFPDSLKELEGQLSALPGFMRPVVHDGTNVSEFILVPFLPHHMKAHAHLEPNQMVYVYLLNPVEVSNPLEPIWIVGALSTEAVMTDEGPAAYRMVDAVTTEYEY